jgi:hypothetical protein
MAEAAEPAHVFEVQEGKKEDESDEDDGREIYLQVTPFCLLL